jgi:S-adenosylmethionine hydrolase
VAVITLTTDFGVTDPFVGSMKGVILSICPDAILVDLSHEIPRHAVTGAVYVLNRCLPYFPKGTVHVAVVDPGVGSARRPLVCSTRGQFVVGPDNGLFGDLCDHDPAAECHAIEAPQFLLAAPSQSPTFQGRDVFAPVAAHVALGVPLDAFGPRAVDPVRINTARTIEGRVGEIVWIDRFGNLISNLHPSDSTDHLAVEIKGRTVPFVSHYGQGPRQGPAALVNSDQVVEIFVNRGDGSAALGASIGTPIKLVKPGGKRRARSPGPLR